MRVHVMLLGLDLVTNHTEGCVDLDLCMNTSICIYMYIITHKYHLFNTELRTHVLILVFEFTFLASRGCQNWDRHVLRMRWPADYQSNESSNIVLCFVPLGT